MHCVFAQVPSVDQQNKILAEARHKLDSVMKNNPAIKKYMNKGSQNSGSLKMPTIPTDVSAGSAFVKSADTAFLSKMKMPEKNVKALGLFLQSRCRKKN